MLRLSRHGHASGSDQFCRRELGRCFKTCRTREELIWMSICSVKLIKQLGFHFQLFRMQCPCFVYDISFKAGLYGQDLYDFCVYHCLFFDAQLLILWVRALWSADFLFLFDVLCSFIMHGCFPGVAVEVAVCIRTDSFYTFYSTHQANKATCKMRNREQRGRSVWLKSSATLSTIMSQWLSIFKGTFRCS